MADLHGPNDETAPLPAAIEPATAPDALLHGFTAEQWSRLDELERVMIEDWAMNPPGGCTPGDVREQLEQSGDVPPWAVPIFITHIEREAAARSGPPFGFTAEQWEYLNRHREAKGEPWFTADEWAAMRPARRRDLCLNLPTATLASPSVPEQHLPAARSPETSASSISGEVRDGSEPEWQAQPILDHEPEATAAQGERRETLRVDPRVSASALITPRELSLCDLWAARKRGRRALDKQVMATNKNTRLIVSGVSLCQFDHGVFMEVVRMSRALSPARGSVRAFVARLRPAPSFTAERRRERSPRRRPVQSSGSCSVDCVAAALERLNGCHIDLTVFKPDLDTVLYSFAGRLIDKLTFSNERGALTFAASLDPAMSVLFEPKRFTYQDPKARSRFGHSPLALWLYGFVECHDLRMAYDVRYLHRISGSKSSDSEFPRLLRAAAAKLEKAKILYTSRIENGKLSMYRKKPPAATATTSAPKDGTPSAEEG
jgi:hypothetical protein